jgi:diguanylate cyclase (GGDEF)-like protein
MPRSQSVRERVVLGVAAMLLPMLALAGISVVAMGTVVERFEANSDEAVQTSLPVARLQSLVYRVERTGIMAAWSGDLDAYEAARDRMYGAFDVVEGEVTAERRYVVAARRDIAATTMYLDLFLSMREQLLATAVTTPSAQVQQQVAALQGSTDDAIRNLETAQQVSAARILDRQVNAQRVEARTTTMIVVVTAIGLLVALGGGLMLSRSVARPLRRLRAAVGLFSAGALSHRVELDRRDEFAELGDALNDMAADLERSQGDLAHQALHDALTGLPNRVLLGDRLEHALTRGRRQARPVALLLIDLDGFKSVNDTLGHGVGDEVLCSAAERLRLCLREEDTAARLGGDEFAVLVDSDTRAHALGVAERILRSMRPAFRHAGRELFLTASIGVAFADRGATAEALLRDADLAMYRAKNGGKNDVCVYDPSMHGEAQERLGMESGLRAALQRGEIGLHYQPVYSLDGTTLVGVEALMRWHHPQRGTVAPTEFIPVAEQSGLINTLGAWALDEACRQLREWRDTVGGDVAGDLRLSVNLSARQLADSSLPTVVAQALERHRIEPYRLMLEITESTMVTDMATTVDRLRELKELGVLLAIDDFGTGYSSLAYLQQFPIDQIKIDKTFVDRIGSPEGQALAEGIINMARALTLEPIAEGIEDAGQLLALDRLGCRLGQGYHFARPETAEQLGRRLAAAPSPSAA